jgi:hypothetical protein
VVSSITVIIFIPIESHPTSAIVNHHSKSFIPGEIYEISAVAGQFTRDGAISVAAFDQSGQMKVKWVLSPIYLVSAERSVVCERIIFDSFLK